MLVLTQIDTPLTDKTYSVYSLFSALIMHVYQMRSSNQAVVSVTQQRLTVCMNALKSVSKVWLVAKMVHTLFESILGNKQLEERLQKAAGKAHRKSKPSSVPQAPSRSESDPRNVMAPVSKRKFDDMDFGTYTGGPPSAQMSYERSRPQSPVNGLKDHGQSQAPGMPTTLANSPPLRQNQDAFMGTSRAGTRQTTPFNTYSYPGTPPDLFLHTRNSPNISQDLWQNYQPDQLFPPDTHVMFPISSPEQPHNSLVDPTLHPQVQPQPPPPQPQFMSQAPMQQTHPTPPQQIPTPIHQTTMHPPPPNGLTPQQQQQAQQVPTPQSHHSMPLGHLQYQDQVSWAHAQSMEAQRQAAEDSWSQNSGHSGGGPAVPTTLNVDDWFQFFGIPNNDMAAMHGQY